MSRSKRDVRSAGVGVEATAGVGWTAGVGGTAAARLDWVGSTAGRTVGSSAGTTVGGGAAA